MFERFGRDARGAVVRAREAATASGAPAVEAEHLLLALAQVPLGRAGRALTGLGLTEQAVRDGLDRELAGALAAVGVGLRAPARATASGPGRGSPRFGQSAKLVLTRALDEAIRAGARTIRAEHLLLAVVDAQAGVIPRLLEELGVTAAEVRAALA